MSISSSSRPPAPTLDPPAAEPNPADIRRSLLFIAYAAFITTLVQDKVLGNLPIRLWLKNHLHVGMSELAGFTFWAGLAWYLKPIFGLVVDAFPLLGTRRRSYMILSAILGAASWMVVSLGQGSYAAFLGGTILLGIFMVFGSTIMGALLVEAGQKYGATGRVSAVREVVQNGCYIITGPIGGFLAGKAFGLTAGIGAGLLLSLAAVAYVYLPEKPVAQRNEHVWSDAGNQLKLVFASRTLWAAAGLIVLFFFSPGFTTPLLYRQQNMLKFSDQFLGTLTLVDGIALVAGGALYGLICRRFELRTLLMVGIVCYGGSALLYLGYHPNHAGAIEIEILAQFLQGVGVLPLYDLATRATPRGGEGMGYALMMSARNIALFGADWVGSKLLEKHLAWDALVWLNAGTTLVCLLLVPFLPSVLMRKREGEDMSEPKVTGEQISAIEPGPHAP